MTRNPRKVLHVMNSAGGGAALSTLGLIGELAREGIASCAVCDDLGTPAERDQLRDAVRGEAVFTRLYWWNRKIRAPRWRRPLIEAKQIWKTGWAHGSASRVARCATQWGADLIHTNTILTPEGGMAAKRLGLPHVWHLRELLGPGHPFRLRREGPEFGRYLAAHCSKLIANSNVTAGLVRGWLPDDLLEVVPNGIDLSRFQPRTTKDDRNRIVVAMIGNLTARWKKHSLFVEAAARVDRDLPIQWRIYGHGQPRGDLPSGDPYVDDIIARVARADLAERFYWPGFVADPAEIMSQVDIVVHPVDQESFGRVVVEAMAAELPVVGVQAGGVGEIVEHGVTGLLARRDDPDELAACIEQLARDPARRRTMGAAGRRRAETDYSLAACAAGVRRVYQAAMSRSLSQMTRDPRPASTAVL